jgi:hypothetical protein
MLEFNDRPVLSHAGSISHERMKVIAEERYERFDNQRRAQEAIEADGDDIRELSDVEEKLTKSGNSPST